MSAAPQNTLLIAGASGVIGAGAVEHFAQLPDWDVIALSRRAPLVAVDGAFTHVSLDLTDADTCANAVAALPPVSHLIYAAVDEAPGLFSGWHDADRMALNGAMFENLLRPLAKSGNLRHVSLLQGAKAYGAHVHPVATPLREDAPRDPHPNFYWLHEDELRATAAHAGFAFTIWRPQVLIGNARGAAMNPILPIAAYAAICRERGLLFALPGNSAAIWELVDTGLLAEGMAWAAINLAAHGQTFNITNGDAFVLRHVWDDLAARIGLDPKGTPPADFTSFFADEVNRQAWAVLAKRNGLIEPSLSAFLGQSHHYLDLLSSPRVAARPPVLLSTIKLRQAGFGACRDSFAALTEQLRQMVELKLLPSLF
ncbi:NAD-dependent epimerase/dehydratase family protein [Sphingorhabdus sp.]|uniref:NAD-dependent epimerase/dehydratase family protein n=1 Tax=Sphingorhabdus sp. TaxID=1902408 RepID=UPI00404729F9